MGKKYHRPSSQYITVFNNMYLCICIHIFLTTPALVSWAVLAKHAGQYGIKNNLCYVVMCTFKNARVLHYPMLEVLAVDK